MKKSLLLFLAFGLVTIATHAQAAAYYCPQTGAMGYCYDVQNPKACAYDAAIRYGAVAPQLILNNQSNGYGAVAVGTNSYGIKVFGIAAGYSSASQAKRIARNACINRGGRRVSISDAWLDI